MLIKTLKQSYNNQTFRLNVAYYKRKYCDDAESSAREQSPLNFVLEKQQTEMPYIPD